MKTLHYQPYIDEMNKMLEAEEFAERFPLFKNYILKNKITNTGRNVTQLGEKVLDVYIGQEIRLCNYSKTLKGTPTNYRGEPIEVPLIVFYINRYSIFGDYFYEEIIKELDAYVYDLVYFYDSINSKYYVTEENLEEFCSKLSIWYNNVIEKNKQYSIEQKKIRLQKELDLLQG